MPKRTSDYRAGLLQDLKDPGEAAEYINAALDDSHEMLLVALRDVAEAHQMANVAQHARISREAIYRMLSGSGNPRFTSLARILKALGLKMAVQPKSRSGGQPMGRRTGNRSRHGAKRLRRRY